MPLDRSQKLSWFVGVPVAMLIVAAIVIVRGGPAGAPPPGHRAAEIADPVGRNLRAIYRGVRFHHLAHGELPQPSAAPTPPLGQCCDHPAGACVPSPSAWQLEPWPSIGFAVHDPDPYSYSYAVEPGGDRFTIAAIGEPSCDGVAVTRWIEGAVIGGEVAPDPRVQRSGPTARY